MGGSTTDGRPGFHARQSPRSPTTDADADIPTQGDINAIKEAIKRMGSIHQEAFLATTGPKEAKLSQELNTLIQETNPKAQRAKAMLGVRGFGLVCVGTLCLPISYICMWADSFDGRCRNSV
jgi:hypothetical protein